MRNASLTPRRTVQVLEGSHLGLDGIEVREAVLGLKFRAVQGREGQRVQVQQLCVGRVPLWQNETLEGHGQRGLRMQPGV